MGAALALAAVLVLEDPGACSGLDDPAGLEWCWQEGSGPAWLFDLSPWLPLPPLLCAPGREGTSQVQMGAGRWELARGWKCLGTGSRQQPLTQSSCSSDLLLAGPLYRMQYPLMLVSLYLKYKIHYGCLSHNYPGFVVGLTK